MNEMQPVAHGQTSMQKVEPAATLPKLTIHSFHRLQWWFAQGSIAHLPSRKYTRDIDAVSGDFMFSLFRCVLPRKEGHPKSIGYMALTAFMPDGADRQASSCCVTENLFEHYIDALTSDHAAGEAQPTLDEDQLRFRNAIAAEMKKYGPFKPTQIRPMAKVEENPLRITWSDVSIAQAGNAIDVHLNLPGVDSVCAFTMTPESLSLDEKSFRFDNTGLDTDYLVCPRMKLDGMAGDHAIVGHGWLEQQSLSERWFKKDHTCSSELPQYGWHWFGINLDDGRDLLIFDIIQHNKAPPEGSAQWQSVDVAGFLFCPGQKPIKLNQLTVEALETWQSPASLAVYPIKMRVLVPRLRVDLIIHASKVNQELPVFGSQVAIWEGKADVEGKIGKDSVTGRARLELNGYANLTNSKSLLKQLTERTDAAIAEFLPRKFNEETMTSFTGPVRWQCDSEAFDLMISNPCWDLLDRGGKHWRPLYGLLLVQAFGADFTPYEDILTILPELVHDGALIIDDIEDNSLTRRGEPCIHLKHGQDTAINAGNMLYFLPMLLLIDHPNLNVEKRERIFGILSRTFVLGHLGQAQDLVWSHRSAQQTRDAIINRRSADILLQGYSHKTAAEIVSIAKVVSVILDLPEDTEAILCSFSEVFGVAFQIIDDVNNFSRADSWGKVTAEDLHEGKPTFVICRAIQAMGDEDQAFLLDVMTSPEMRSDAKNIDKAIGLIRQSGELERCRQHALGMLEGEWERLERVLPSSLAKVVFKSMCYKLFGNLA